MTAEGRAQVLLNNARGRAKKSGLEFTIDREWIAERLRRGICEATGVPLDYSQTGAGKGGSHPWSPSLDRIDNAKGYTPENTQVVVWIYNSAKNTFDHQTVVQFARALIAKEDACSLQR